MTEKQKYTAEDIRLYLEGKLTPQQMHALEMAALNDPFIADAIGGISQYGNNEHFAADMRELNVRLNERVRKRGGVVLPATNLWWKIAAVLLIVITGVAVIIFSGENNDIDKVRFAKSEKKKEKASVPDTVSRDASLFSQSAPDSKLISTQKNKDTPKVKSQSRTTSSKPAIVKSETSQNLREVSSSSPKKHMEQENRALEADVVKVEEGVGKQKAEDDAKVADAIEGRVAGMEVQASDVHDSVYDAVVIVGTGNRSYKSRTLADDRIKRRIIPEKGWDHFERYIVDSANIASADSVYSGEELVTFTIGDDGLPESVKILRSVSPAHDREVIRLLRYGPSWKVIKGEKRNVRLKIIF